MFLSRIKALFRRSHAAAVVPLDDENIIEFGRFVINANSRTTTIDNEKVAISSNEFDVLWQLVSAADNVVSRQDLVTQRRGFEYDGFDRSIDILVSRIRKKLGDDASNPFRIKTIWGKGYLLAKDSW